jgi:hypothetical protein
MDADSGLTEPASAPEAHYLEEMIAGLSAARAQMALSLGFQMVLAASGIALPLLILMAKGLLLSTGRPHDRDLARKWAKATGLLFALGAVSGTARKERTSSSDRAFANTRKVSCG